MKGLWWLLAPVFLLPAGAAENPDGGSEAPLVYVIPIRDDIMPPLLYVVRRGVKQAISEGADTIVLDMETDGGRVDTTEEIIHVLDRFKGQKVTWVNSKAYSAGAFISVATQKIYMAPKSVIGAAAPIAVAPGGMGVEQLPSTMEVKITSAISALIRANAEQNGHDTEVIEAMIDKAKSLERDGEVICAEGALLTLTNREAERRYGPSEKPLLSLGTVASLEDLLAELDLEGAQVVRIEPTGSEQLGAWINRISPILLMIGLIGLYLEFKTPGFGLPGIVGISAFALYFLGGYIAGLSSIGWGALFVLGLLLLIVEILLIPGTLIAGLAGAGLMVGAILMALVDWDPSVPGVALPSARQLSEPLFNLGLGTAGAMLAILLIGKHFSRIPVFSSMISHSACAMQTERSSESLRTSLFGQEGVAVTPLHPGGRARFGNRIVDVVTQGEMLDEGTPLRIVEFGSVDPVVSRA